MTNKYKQKSILLSEENIKTIKALQIIYSKEIGTSVSGSEALRILLHKTNENLEKEENV